MNKARFTLAQINALTREDFTRVVGPVFEHSAWIATGTWPRRPFTSLDHLHQSLCQTVRDSDAGRRVALIEAHPDLVGSAALAGTLTLESAREQASAGLDDLSAADIGAFQNFNQAYREKFGFPFVICARLNKKEAILKAFPERLAHTREEEIATALEEISKIARLRLEDLICS